MSLEYQVIKAKRKTIAVSVNPLGEIVVRAPINTSNGVIEEFIKQHLGWINGKIAIFNNTTPDISALKSLEYTYILGEKYMLHFNILGRGEEYLDEANKCIYLRNATNKLNRLIIFLKKCANEYIMERCWQLYRENQGLIFSEIAQVKLTNSKARWGACTSAKILHFNWRAIMLDRDELDYLICHELCHIRHLNHSKEFWSCVATIYPNYKLKRKSLKSKGYLNLLYR